MPRRQRAAESSRVTFRPAKLTWPAPGDRSPEMRPNRLVLPAPFGPTIPIVSPAPTEKLRSSAMTTRPNRFVTWSSSRSGLVMLRNRPYSGESGQEIACSEVWGEVSGCQDSVLISGTCRMTIPHVTGPQWSSSGPGGVRPLAERRQQIAGDLCLREQGVVDHDGLKLVLGALLP